MSWILIVSTIAVLFIFAIAILKRDIQFLFFLAFPVLIGFILSGCLCSVKHETKYYPIVVVKGNNMTYAQYDNETISDRSAEIYNSTNQIYIKTCKSFNSYGLELTHQKRNILVTSTNN